jgi:hypothetical protein
LLYFCFCFGGVLSFVRALFSLALCSSYYFFVPHGHPPQAAFASALQRPPSQAHSSFRGFLWLQRGLRGH